MRTTYRIELKVDIDPSDEHRKAVMEEVVKTAAQMIYAQAIMAAGKRKPDIAVLMENAFLGKEQIGIEEE